MSKSEKYEIPEILYEEPQPGLTPNPIPYIAVSKTSKMPEVIFIFEYKSTGEMEPDNKGNPVEVVDQIPHKYVDMEHLKESLPPEINDIVRVSLGMKPLLEAQKEGQVILDKAMKNAEAFRQEKLSKKDDN